MDSNLWKLLVDKAISRTKSGDLMWSKSSEGPTHTLSFVTSIDASTTLNIWGYEANYSYELHLTKQTVGESFEERKRVTLRKNAEGINFNGLFKAARGQVAAVPRDRAFAILKEYLADPKVLDQEKQEEFLEQWAKLGYGNFFSYAQAEEILSLIKDRTVGRSIAWTAGDGKERDSEGLFYTADVGELIYLLFHPHVAPGKGPRSTTFELCIMSNDDNDNEIEMHISPTAKEHARRRRLLAEELHASILDSVREVDAKFDKIVREDTFHEILKSLDTPHETSLPG